MNPENNLISKPKLAASLALSTRTLSRWMSDAALAFPASIIMHNRHYFRLSDIEEWKALQLRKSTSVRASFRASTAEPAA